MSLAERTAPAARASKPGRLFGYMVAIAVNLGLLYVVNNLMAWDVVSFLTDDFGRLLWLVDLSLIASILANVAYLVYDAVWFRSVTQIGLNLIALVVAARTYQVFPFDFAGFDVNWDPVVRTVIVVAMLGLVIATIVEIVRLVRSGVETLG